MGELDEFTEFLFGKESGYVYTPHKTATNEWVEKFFHWPTERSKCLDHIRITSLENDVYISPVLHKGTKHSKDSLKHSSVCWIEFDGKVSLDFKGVPDPSYIVQSSTADHQHVYWKTEGNLEAIEDVNRRLTYYLEADSSGWDITQVLRPPETINHKPGKNLQVQVIKSQISFVELSSFDKAPEIPKVISNITYEEILDPTETLKRLKLGKEMEDRILKEIPVNIDRSRFMMSTGHLLAEQGLTHIEIVTLLYAVDFRLKKFVGRADQLIRLSEIASIALLKVQSGNQVEAYSFLDILEYKDRLQWLIDGFLHAKGLMLLSGAPGVGKTIFVNNLIHWLATGKSVLGKQPVDALSVAFFSIEMDIDELQYFIEMHSKDWLPEDSEAIRKNTMTFFPEEASLQYIEAVVKATSPKIVFIDSLSELTEDLEEKEARRIMKFFRRLKREYNCAFILIHHNRKANSTNKKPIHLSDLYGSYVIGKLSETVLCLWHEEKGNYYELYGMKGRFNNKETIKMYRNENLNYRLMTEEELANVSGRPRETNSLTGLFTI